MGYRSDPSEASFSVCCTMPSNISSYASREVKKIRKRYKYCTASMFISLLMTAHSDLICVAGRAVWIPPTNKFSHTSRVLHNSTQF